MDTSFSFHSFLIFLGGMRKGGKNILITRLSYIYYRDIIHPFFKKLPLKTVHCIVSYHTFCQNNKDENVNRFTVKGDFLVRVVIKDDVLKTGFRSREPDGSNTLRHPVDILLLELMKAYIFFITLGTLLKSLFTNMLYFELWEKSQNRRLRNPT